MRCLPFFDLLAMVYSVETKKGQRKFAAFFCHTVPAVNAGGLEHGVDSSTDACHRPEDECGQKYADKYHRSHDASFVGLLNRTCVDVFSFHIVSPFS